MADIVLKPNEVILDSKRYPIMGHVSPRLVSTQPSKVVIGEYSKDSEAFLSSWITSDQRGGMLVERMDEATQADRFWYSTCNTDHKGHIFLPDAAGTVSLPTSSSLTVTNSGFETPDTGWTVVDGEYNSACTYSTAQKAAGTYSMKIYAKAGYAYNEGTYFYQDIAGYAAETTYNISFQFYGGSTSTNYAYTYCDIDDGGSATRTYIASAGVFAKKTIQYTTGAAPSRLRIKFGGYAKKEYHSTTAYVDSVVVAVSDIDVGSFVKAVEFNSHLYFALGAQLCRLDETTGDALVSVTTFSTDITDLVVSMADKLLIYLGDADEYYYMDTAEDFVETDELTANLGIKWDNKAWKLSTANVMSYATTPAAAEPEWTANGTIDVDDNTIENLLVARDASGEMIIYAGGNTGLYAHDFNNAQWLETELTIPKHPNGGEGLCRWREGIYISAGLAVYKYVPGYTTTISPVGLDQDDGLPSELRGVITGFTPGFSDFYASVDSSSITETSTSSLLKRNASGWRILWLAPAVNLALKPAVVSSVYEYRLWFSHNNQPYYIKLPTDDVCPLKDATHTYDSNGVHITGWFDANWESLNKTAVNFKVYTDGCSATETVTVSYRTDYSYTTIDDGWTELGTIVADGETEYSFGSGAGVAFKAIQFRFDLARGTTTTSTPDVQWYALGYRKKSDPVWGWQFDLDLTKNYDGKTPKQMIDDLFDLYDNTTFVLFAYREETTETHYVELASLRGKEKTGEGIEGVYSVFVVAP